MVNPFLNIVYKQIIWTSISISGRHIYLFSRNDVEFCFFFCFWTLLVVLLSFDNLEFLLLALPVWSFFRLSFFSVTYNSLIPTSSWCRGRIFCNFLPPCFTWLIWCFLHSLSKQQVLWWHCCWCSLLLLFFAVVVLCCCCCCCCCCFCCLCLIHTLASREINVLTNKTSPTYKKYMEV